MKRRTFSTIGGIFFLAAATAHAGWYFSDFSGLANDLDDPTPAGALNGYGGWNQSEANVAANSPLSWGQSVDGADGAALGGFYATPNASSMNVSQSIGLPFAVDALAPVPSQISMTFTIGRDAGVDPFVQNTFEVGAYQGSSNLFSVVFQRNDVDQNVWEVFYRGGGGTNTTLSNAVVLDNFYTLTMGFTKDNADANFSLALSNLSNSMTVGTSGVLAGLGNSTIDSLRVSMLQVPGEDLVADPFSAYGTNYLAFTDVAVIPEPGSVALLSLAAGALFLRRRRA